MFDLKKVQPILLVYEEAGYLQASLDCIKASGLRGPILADREGVGSMSKAFNLGIRELFHNGHPSPDYVWFITNVTFPAEMPQHLVQALEIHPKAAAVHPKFQSDHPHIRNVEGIEEGVPFIEWTAPMVRFSALKKIGILDEKMPYVHFDLDWSARAKAAGFDLLACGRSELKHTYLYKQAPERISTLRAQLRQLRHPDSLAALVAKYGHDWKNKLCPTGTCG